MSTQSRMPLDANAKSMQVLKPGVTEDVTASDSSPCTSTVIRVVSAAGATIGVNGPAVLVLPANSVEYFRVDVNDVITVAGSLNITQMV